MKKATTGFTPKQAIEFIRTHEVTLPNGNVIKRTIWHADEIIELLENITSEAESEILRKYQDRIASSIIRELPDPEDFIQYGDAEFEIRYNNCIELTHVPIDDYRIEEAINNGIEEFIDLIQAEEEDSIEPIKESTSEEPIYAINGISADDILKEVAEITNIYKTEEGAE